MKFCRNKLVPEYITGKQELSKEDVVIRVPLISGYNTEEDIKNSICELKNIGFSQFDIFRYKIDSIK